MTARGEQLWRNGCTAGGRWWRRRHSGWKQSGEVRFQVCEEGWERGVGVIDEGLRMDISECLFGVSEVELHADGFLLAMILLTRGDSVDTKDVWGSGGVDTL